MNASVFTSNTSKLIIGFVSFPKAEIAKNVARILIKEKLAACVKLINGLDSFYMWENELQEEQEVYLMIKSKESKIEEIKKILDKKHPYKVYEFLYHEVKSANDKYTDWINSSLIENSENIDNENENTLI